MLTSIITTCAMLYYCHWRRPP